MQIGAPLFRGVGGAAPGGGTGTGGGDATGGGSATPTPLDVTADIAADTTWTSDHIYTLKQLTYVQAGATLTIQPGTTVLGDPGSALIVSRDARLVADGTAQAPIVFSSSLPVGERGLTAADGWGGVLLLGRAPINTVGGEENAEGVADESRNRYGGTDAAYDCGVIRYVRIEFAGIPVSAANELNGLTINGCGTGTLIDYVQVHRGIDDGIEIFGGTVNVKHLVLSGNDDDALDWDRGWTGKAQFIAIQQTQGYGNHAIEASSNPNNSTLTPVAHPVIYNLTAVGRAPDSSNPGEGVSRGINLKEGTQGEFYNFIITNFYERALYVVGDDARAAWGTELFVKNSVFFANPTDAITDSGFGEDTKVLDAALSNQTVDPGLAAAKSVTAPDFKPTATLTGSATPPDDGFFDPTATFIGAIGSVDWTAGWTAYPEN